MIYMSHFMWLLFSVVNIRSSDFHFVSETEHLAPVTVTTPSANKSTNCFSKYFKHFGVNNISSVINTNTSSGHFIKLFSIIYSLLVI